MPMQYVFKLTVFGLNDVNNDVTMLADMNILNRFPPKIPRSDHTKELNFSFTAISDDHRALKYCLGCKLSA